MRIHTQALAHAHINTCNCSRDTMLRSNLFGSWKLSIFLIVRHERRQRRENEKSSKVTQLKWNRLSLSAQLPLLSLAHIVVANTVAYFILLFFHFLYTTFFVTFRWHWFIWQNYKNLFMTGRVSCVLVCLVFTRSIWFLCHFFPLFSWNSHLWNKLVAIENLLSTMKRVYAVHIFIGVNSGR